MYVTVVECMEIVHDLIVVNVGRHIFSSPQKATHKKKVSFF